MKYVLSTIIVIIIIAGGIYFYQNNQQKNVITSNIQQNMKNDTATNNDQDKQEMTNLVKNIYQAFQQKDTNTLLTLSKTRNTNLALKANQSLDLFEKDVSRQWSIDFNDNTEYLLPVDFSTINFIPQDDQTLKVQVVYSNRKSTNNPIVYLSKDTSLDMTSEQEIYIAKINSNWMWVK